MFALRACMPSYFKGFPCACVWEGRGDTLVLFVLASVWLFLDRSTTVFCPDPSKRSFCPLSCTVVGGYVGLLCVARANIPQQYHGHTLYLVVFNLRDMHLSPVVSVSTSILIFTSKP
ncbi:unnamed protein product [Pylaiella littoralis]